MRIAVLDLTGHPLPLLEGIVRSGQQIITWLSQALPEAEYRFVDVEDAQEPMPVPGSFDGLVVSGSQYGVYDDRPWNGPLRRLLLKTKAAGKPIYGICFGHQIMADTFGGKAEKSQIGTVVGARQFDFANGPVDAYVWHQDQVSVVPPNARITARTGYCPVGALEYDFPAASVQFHPEYTESHLREIFARGAGLSGFLSVEQANGAMASFGGVEVKADLMAKEAADFFRMHIKMPKADSTNDV